jgi:hypothetical protein
MKDSRNPNSIRCKCGYCGIDSTTGLYFVPKYPGQKYLSLQHYLRHQYNGKKPIKKICACGCKKKFYTINKNKEYIKGHQTKFVCSFCQEKLSMDEIRKKKINNDDFYFCVSCWNNIYNSNEITKDKKLYS